MHGHPRHHIHTTHIPPALVTVWFILKKWFPLETLPLLQRMCHLLYSSSVFLQKMLFICNLECSAVRCEVQVYVTIC